MSWVGFRDNKGFKGSIRQEDEEQKLQKDKAYSIAEFPVFSGTSQKSRRIDLLGIENITKDHHEKYELNLHGVEIKVSKSDDDFEQDTNDALLQIEKKKYYEPFVRKVTINTIYCYGISFYNKQCYIAGKKIK